MKTIQKPKEYAWVWANGIVHTVLTRPNQQEATSAQLEATHAAQIAAGHSAHIREIHRPS